MKYILFILCYFSVTYCRAQADTAMHLPPAVISCFDTRELLNLQEVRQLIGYPPIAKEAGIKGDVMFRVLFDEQGNYIKHKVIKTAHPLLYKACEPYLPCLKLQVYADEKPESRWFNVPFRFY